MTLEQAKATVGKIRSDPAYFLREVLGVQRTYPKQVQMLEALRDMPRVSVVGANGTGKDFCTARAILWWQMSHYPAKTVVIGPTYRQVADIVWAEARSGFNGARVALGGQMFATPMWKLDADSFATGFATDKPENIFGFHSPNLLVIVTEAHNVEQSHLDAIKRLNPSKVLLSGNAFTNAGDFYDSHHGKPGYYPIHISAFDTPNVQQKRLVIPGLVTWEDVEERKRDWGVDSPLYKSAVLAEFPDTPEGAVFRNVEGCVYGEQAEPYRPGRRYCWGLDLAKVGDYTWLTIGDAETRRCVYMDRFNRVDWSLQKARIYEAVMRYGNGGGLLDSTGLGDPILEDLRGMGLNVRGYNFGGGHKKTLIDKLVLAIEQERIRYPRWPVLLGELKIYRYEMTQAQNVKTNAPSGFHDDGVISLALLNECMGTSGSTTRHEVIGSY